MEQEVITFPIKMYSLESDQEVILTSPFSRFCSKLTPFSISSQMTKLEEFPKKFCIKFDVIAAQIFDWLLKDKSCVE